jgi:hypothetical protein
MKGIAIQTILLLLVGILVVGILVYMVYRYTAGKSLSSDECRAQFIVWCTNCYSANITKGAGGTLPSTLHDCLLGTMNIDLATSSTCATAKSYCQQFGVSW